MRRRSNASSILVDIATCAGWPSWRIALVGSLFTLGACFAGGAPIDPIADGSGGGLVEPGGGPPAPPIDDTPTTEPHAVIGTTPSHGTFAGGQRVIVRGNGFASDARVWLGDAEVTEVVPIDPSRVQITTPPGAAGPVDVTVQNGDDASTRRTLAGGYTYDAIEVSPTSGPTAGGNELVVVGQGTAFGPATKAFVGGSACEPVEIRSATELACTVPKGTPGAKPVRVESSGEPIVVLDAYTYEDSDNGFKGGLSGDPLAGELRVLAFDNFTGTPLVGAHVVVGTSVASGIVRTIEGTSGVTISDPSLTSPQTVSVSAVCHSPITFVDVTVDTVTAYLDPVLSPACAAMGDPPGVGGKSGSSGGIEGEIVFPATDEFARGAFTVPSPLGAEQVVAYVLTANQSPTSQFVLPSPAGAITPASPGGLGYAFESVAPPGNRTLYALAGIEDRTKNPPKFTAYAFGVARGIPVLGGATTSAVYIPMVALEQALDVVPSPPPPGPVGPDRLQAAVALRLGNDGFALFPGGQKSPALPLAGDVSFVGLPVLDGPLANTTFFVSARAVTGVVGAAPMSVVGSVQTNTTAFPIVVDGFVGIPSLTTPAPGAPWNGTQLATKFGPGAPVDLTVIDATSGSGLVRWTIAIPGGARAVTLPDLREFPGEGLPSGPVVLGVYGARIDGFDYAKLRYRNLRPAGMTAYGLDYVDVVLP